MIIKCKMCGGDLSFAEGTTVCECEYCGSKQTLPNVDNEKKGNQFNRANRLRMNSEFDKAAMMYESIVAEFPEEAEAYWGLCLCAYGIEYVDDPATGKRMPTCHRTMPTSIMEDKNFEQACDCADSVARRVYRDEAKAIDRIQRDILAIAANEAPYDVFICYKETAEDGSRTEDSVLAQDIYDTLTAKGLKVFFSRITLENKLGMQYEPYIYAALSSAKVMLAVGTRFEYYDAVWVKNEWSRFLGMMKTDKRKTLIPCFKELDAYDIPKEFKGLQAQDMGKLGWLQDLVRGTEKLCGKETTAAATPVATQTVVREVVQNSNAENLMKRVYLFLEDGDFAQAEEYINKVLDVDAEYAPAYVGKVMVKYRLKKEADLGTLKKSLDGDTDWQKALRFADERQKQTYLSYAKTVNDNQSYAMEQARIEAENKIKQALIETLNKIKQARIEAENKARQAKYDAAVSKMNCEGYAAAIKAFIELNDYMDSLSLVRKCIDCYRRELGEIEKAKKMTEPIPVAATENVNQAEQAVNKARDAAKKARENQAEAAKQKNTISEELRSLNFDLSRLHGLFSGGKRHKIEAGIEIFKREQQENEQRLSNCEKEIRSAESNLEHAQFALEEARKSLTVVEEELNNSIISELSDDVVISTAEREAPRQETRLEALTTPGNTITFGRYMQNHVDTKEPIEWQVLATEENKVLLISVYGLDVQPYNTSDTSVTWETCTLRGWLNKEFISTAFTANEQKSILTTSVDNSQSQCYDVFRTSGGNNTQDKVFLLSCAEARKYFKVYYNNVNGPNIGSRVKPTAYAKAHGAYTSSSDKTSDGSAAGTWWLRSPYVAQNGALIVYSIGTHGGSLVYMVENCVRPALWVNLKSGAFKSYILTGEWQS